MKRMHFIIVILSLSFTFAGCGGGGAGLLSEWSGTFAGDAAGLVEYMKLFDDDSLEARWSIPGYEMGVADGTYTLSGETFMFTGSGNAVREGSTTTFSLMGSGTLSGSAGSGTYSIEFEDPAWYDASGTWDVTRR
ncbi:MAG: hypothetical protein ABIJ56_20610 [Pseudomonadota bacterium]